jgi:hypothetical protein
MTSFLYKFIIKIFIYKEKMADVFSGFLNGALSMFGMGSLYDKMGDASSELKQIQNKTNNLTSVNTLLFAEDVVSGMETLRELNSLTQSQQTTMQQQTMQFINDSLQKENLFILFCYLLVFILIVFFLIQKKCC